MKLISQIVIIWQGGDGAIAEFIEDGSPLDVTDRFERVRALPAPAKEIGAYLLLEDGARFRLALRSSSGEVSISTKTDQMSSLCPTMPPCSTLMAASASNLKIFMGKGRHSGALMARPSIS